MPVEVTLKLYKLPELMAVSNTAYAKALDRVRGNVSPDLVTEDDHVEETMLAAGFEDARILVDTSCTQGSGASFTCRRVDVRKMLAYLDLPTERGTDCPYPDGKVPAIAGYVKDAILACPEVFASIERTERAYVHEGTCRVEVAEARDADGNDLPDDVVNAIREAVDTVRRDFCRWLHELQTSYDDDANSESALREYADANGYLFTERGRIAGYGYGHGAFHPSL